MNDMVDVETGELTPMPISAAAIQQRKNAEPQFIMGSELGVALAKAVSEMPIWIKQDAEVQAGARKMKYATLKTILNTVRPVLMNNGIRIRQGANASWTMDGGGVKGRLVPIYTDLIHSETGQTDRTIIEIPVTKLDAQAMGSALSYGRRYSLLAALGLATDEADDDGAATKTASITDEHEDSQELWTLKEEIKVIDDTLKLTAWGEKLKGSRRLDVLSEAERAMLAQFYRLALKTLSERPEKVKK